MFADFFRLSWETTTSQSVVVLVCVPRVVPLDYRIGPRVVFVIFRSSV